jgi:hypothetical protein
MQPLTQKPVQPGEFFNAVRASNLELVQELLARGANINERDNVGNTPLMYVSGSTGYSLKFVQLLLDHGAHIDEQSNSGNTALLLACSVNNIAAVKLLLDRGAALDKRNKRDFTAEDVGRNWNYPLIVKLITDAIESRRKTAEEKARIVAEHDKALRSQQELKEKAKRRQRPPSL